MMPATEGVLRLQMKSKSSMPWTALGCRPLQNRKFELLKGQLTTPTIRNIASCHGRGCVLFGDLMADWEQ